MGAKNLLNQMLELVMKSSAMLDLVNPGDGLKIMEMSLNRNDIMLDKSKLLLLKVDKLFIVIPLTLTKVETRLRNVIINGKPKFDGLSRFLQFYLQTFVSPVVSQGEHP